MCSLFAYYDIFSLFLTFFFFFTNNFILRKKFKKIYRFKLVLKWNNDVWL